MPDIDLEPHEFRRTIKYNPWMMVLGGSMGVGILVWVWFIRDNVGSDLLFIGAAMGAAIVGIFFALLTKDIPYP